MNDDFFQPGMHVPSAPRDRASAEAEHPDPDQLSAFAEQALPAHEYEATLTHLALCPRCRSVVALALPARDEAPQPATVNSWKGWFTGWNLAWPAGAGLALASLAAVIVYVHHDQLTQRQLRMQSQTAVLRPSEPAAPASSPAFPKEPIARNLEQVTEQATQGPPSFRQDSSESFKPLASVPGKKREPGVLSASGRPGPSPVAEPVIPKDSVDQAQAPLAAAPPVDGSTAVVSAGKDTPSLLADVRSRSSESGNLVLNSNSLAKAPLSYGGPANSAPAALLTQVARPLPSGLPILSSTSANHLSLAIDSHHALFASEDDGEHWTPVAVQWSGRALRVNLAGPRPATSPSRLTFGFSGVRPTAATALAAPTAFISGTVTDVTGAIIPKATVQLSNQEIQATLSFKTDSAGHYQSPSLLPGTYQVEAEAPGFQKRLVSGVALKAGQSLQSNLTLEVGAASQTVSVNAAPLQLDVSASQPDARTAVAGKVSNGGLKPLRSTAAAPPLFEMLTDSGERWVSQDGQLWKQASSPAK